MPSTYRNWTEFRQYLLSETLKYVLDRIPFYQKLRPLNSRPSVQLEDFPMIDNRIVSSNLWEFVALDSFPDYLVTTGGTTGAGSTITFRNDDEYQAVHSFLADYTNQEKATLDSIEDFTLDIFVNTNGHYPRRFPGDPTLSVTLEQPAHAEIIRRLIQDGIHFGDRVVPARRVQSQNGTIRTLTGYFWVTGFEPRNFDMRSLLTYGGHLSETWTQRLRDFWGADVLTLYGLSEFAVGNAMQCRECGSYHYWTAWPEFWAIDGAGPVESGDAQLVLTSLVPFTKVQPRIRYTTGDIVTLTGFCSLAEQQGFRFRGRLSSSVVDDSGTQKGVLLSELEVIEVLDRLPNVFCRPHASELSLWSTGSLSKPPFSMGAPQFKIWSPQQTGIVRIGVEVNFDPISETVRADRFREQFVSTFSRYFSDRLDRLSDNGLRIEIEIVSPASLGLNIKPTA